MSTLYNKIRTLYPSLTEEDFRPRPGGGTIHLFQDGLVTPIPAGKGRVGRAYIKEWNHPTVAEPTQQQLDAINNE